MAERVTNTQELENEQANEALFEQQMRDRGVELVAGQWGEIQRLEESGKTDELQQARDKFEAAGGTEVYALTKALYDIRQKRDQEGLSDEERDTYNELAEDFNNGLIKFFEHNIEEDEAPHPVVETYVETEGEDVGRIKHVDTARKLAHAQTRHRIKVADGEAKEPADWGEITQRQVAEAMQNFGERHAETGEGKKSARDKIKEDMERIDTEAKQAREAREKSDGVEQARQEVMTTWQELRDANGSGRIGATMEFKRAVGDDVYMALRNLKDGEQLPEETALKAAEGLRLAKPAEEPESTPDTEPVELAPSSDPASVERRLQERLNRRTSLLANG